MWEAAAMLTVACVLFISMGLEGEVERILELRFRILSCPKCSTFWSVLVLNLVSGYGIVRSISVAFLCSYAALWLTLLLDALATLYNKLYEQISNPDTSEADSDETAEADHAEVSQM